MGRRRSEQERIPVGDRFGDHIRTNDATGAWLVFDDDLLAEGRR
jgi:hypothetical protein